MWPFSLLKAIGPLARLGVLAVVIYAATTVDLNQLFQSLLPSLLTTL